MKRALAFALLLVLLYGVRQVISATGPAADDESVAVVNHVDVTPNFTEAGRDLLRQVAEATRKDPGIVRVDVFEELGRPNHSTVVTVWQDRRAYDASLAADHTRTFRAKIQPMLGSPFDERIHRVAP